MQTTLRRLPLLRYATAYHIALATEFLRFGMVGLAGLIVDTTTVYGTRDTFGLYGALLFAYAVAASCTWLLNRIWTFKGRGSGPIHRQWALFMVANLAGFVLNRGTCFALVTYLPVAADQPVIATAAGAIAGMFVNFSLSRRVVFR